MKMINVIFMGTPDFAVPILEKLIKHTNVIMVVTQPDRYVGRKKELTYSPIKNKALENNIPVFQPDKIRTDYEEIKKYNPDLIVTCAYGQIVPKEVLNIPRLGCINVHASILPKYRGGAPIHYAVINGEEETGITIMYMDEGMDTGDIIKIEKIKIENNDTVETMHDKLSVLGANLLEKVLPDIINGTNNRIKQNDEEATYAPTIKREDEHLDFSECAIKVYNKVRGLNSWPLANMILDNEEIKVIEGYIGEETNELPGKIVNILKDAIGVACKDKMFYITKIKPFGKKSMLVKDYLNGINKEDLLKRKIK
ncbi:MAG: methionyl-tRNA formyltransferase [Firmicutes bacterium]|nr:methionyl-tRNA formyltransferase [Bacillota bacterium]